MKMNHVISGLLIVFLSGCGGSGATGTPLAAVAIPPKPVVDFSPAILSLAVGVYTGDCYSDIALRNRVDATLSLTSDFMLKYQTVSGSMQGLNMTLGAGRKFDSSGPRSAFFSANVGILFTDGLGFSLSADATGGSGKAEGKDSPSVFCGPLPATGKLLTRSIYTALAKYLGSSSRELSCSNGKNLQYQLELGEAKLGDQIYSLLTGLKSESVVLPSFSGNVHDTMMYASEAMDGRTLNLFIDHYGDLQTVSMATKAGELLSCISKI